MITKVFACLALCLSLALLVVFAPVQATATQEWNVFYPDDECDDGEYTAPGSAAVCFISGLWAEYPYQSNTAYAKVWEPSSGCAGDLYVYATGYGRSDDITVDAEGQDKDNPTDAVFALDYWLVIGGNTFYDYDESAQGTCLARERGL